MERRNGERLGRIRHVRPDLRTLGPVLCLLLVALAFPLSASARPFTVVIDPGHGGRHEGAVSTTGVKEKDVALAVAQRLKALLAAEADVRVVMTRERDEDLSLADRMTLANLEKGDVFLSIHCNSMPTRSARQSANGVETYLLSVEATDAEANALAARENAEGGNGFDRTAIDPIGLILNDLVRTQAHEDAVHLAGIVHRHLVERSGARDRGVRQAPFAVLTGAEMPAILVEVGFISHPVEGRRLATAAYQQRIAEALRDAVNEFRREVYAQRVANVASAAGIPRSPDAVALEDVTVETSAGTNVSPE